MEAQQARIKPSRQARRLFGLMVQRADTNLHLPLSDTLELSVERTRAGHHDGYEIGELLDEEWISPAPDGGWLLH